MNLTDEQKQIVTGWMEEGLKVADVQQKMDEEFSLSMTYMEVRFLLDDLRLNPKDPVEPEPEPEAAATPESQSAAGDAAGDPSQDPAAGSGKVTLSVDAITRPGSLASGKVTFSDGKNATWYFDQMGRLGVVADDKSYKPSPADVEDFQMQLQTELSKLGL